MNQALQYITRPDTGLFKLQIDEIETPRPDSGLSADDIRDVIRRLQEAIKQDPGLKPILGFLLEDVPEVYKPGAELQVLSFLYSPATIITLGPRLSRRDKQRAANAIEDLFNSEIQRINERLVDGSIGVEAWYESVRKEISAGHVSTYSAGRSGAWSSITFQEWGRLGQRIRRQNQFLQGFADELRKQDPETYSLKYLNNRVGLYGSNFRESLESGIARDRGLDPSVLPAIPGDGSTRCLTRCKCRWTIRPAGRDRFVISWRLGNAEHCSTCNNRADDWVGLEIHKGRLVSPLVPHFHNHQ